MENKQHKKVSAPEVDGPIMFEIKNQSETRTHIVELFKEGYYNRDIEINCPVLGTDGLKMPYDQFLDLLFKKYTGIIGGYIYVASLSGSVTQIFSHPATIVYPGELNLPAAQLYDTVLDPRQYQSSCLSRHIKFLLCRGVKIIYEQIPKSIIQMVFYPATTVEVPGTMDDLKRAYDNFKVKSDGDLSFDLFEKKLMEINDKLDSIIKNTAHS